MATTWTYPAAPGGWTIGDAWPESFPPTPYDWELGDMLPIGVVKLSGITAIYKRIIPLNIDTDGVWYNIDGTLWTSKSSTDNILELDEYINADLPVRTDIPDYNAVLNEHFISFGTKLQVTSARYDDGYLLYLPKINEQQFSKKDY